MWSTVLRQTESCTPVGTMPTPASLLGAAKVLSQNRDRFGGELRFLFQPAEETGKGAPDFINAGALDGAERILGLHSAPDLPLGTIGLTPGLNNAAVDHFRILVHGKAAHVSTPQLARMPCMRPVRSW